MVSRPSLEIAIRKLSLGPYDNNSYILVCPATQEGVVIDTPAEPARLLQAARDVAVRYLLITHTHPDHLGAFSEVRAKLGAPVGVHATEAANLSSPPDLLLQDGALLSFGRFTLRVLHTPGHTPGSLCFLVERHLFSGDTLFPGGPGKSRSPEALQEIRRSLEAKIFPLPDDTLVYPGHGPGTVLGKEKAEYLVFCQRPHDPGLCSDVLWLSS